MPQTSNNGQLGFFDRAKSPRLTAWLFVTVVCASVFSITGWRIRHAYYLQVDEGGITTANLARSLSDQAHATIHAAATIASGVAERLENDGASEAALSRLNRVLTRFVATTPGINHLVVFSAAGDALVTSFTPMPKVNVADRDYFVYHRDHRDTRPFVGPPIRNRADGRWSFTVSRRFDTGDGMFGGVVVAVIDCEAFVDFYRNFNIGPRGSIWLMHEDATLLARQPPIPDTIGKNVNTATFVREYREHGPVGTGDSVSQIDGVSRIASYRRLDEYPLVVFVAFSKDDILGGWRNNAIVELLVSLIVSSALGVFAWRLVNQFGLRDRQNAAARRDEEQYRLLADYSDDLIIQFGPDGRRQYISPSCERMLGYLPSELSGKHPRDTIHPEDWPTVEAHRAEILKVDHAEPISYRVRRKDGVYLWVETRGRKLAGNQGVVVTVRDISSRKRVEGLLHEANNHLQRQVMLDGLTGIPNRRCFDLTFEKEYRRSARSQTPLGVLMIDVDFFKKYNDLYGHPAGDACLRAVTEAVEQQLRRPADFAARYGGEEFVTLLPDTDVDGALVMAERIRSAIELLGIKHDGNRGSVVTVSIGVAVGWPQRGESRERKVLQAADSALYRAKQLGRNQVSLPKPDSASIASGELETNPAE